MHDGMDESRIVWRINSIPIEVDPTKHALYFEYTSTKIIVGTEAYEMITELFGSPTMEGN